MGTGGGPRDGGGARRTRQMDIVAHALWAGAGIALARRRFNMPRRVALATVVCAVLPDVVHLVPLFIAFAIGQVDAGTLWAYSFARPGGEPAMPAWVGLASHHLHCLLHSAVVAALVTVAVTARRGRRDWAWPLAGWWSHIVIDVFTHSAAYYPVPVFYPFSYAGLDAIAWNTPAFFAINYGALAIAYGLLWRTGRRSRRAAPH